ncbi:hypothetical protein EC991_011364 [Linnemannia zychae]|nr:hypothetical protein EC991_011364 [Linnemannia zychae]
MYDPALQAEMEAYRSTAPDDSDTFETHVISTIHLSRNDHHFSEFLFEIILFELAAAIPPNKTSNSVRLEGIHWAVRIAQGFIRSYGLDSKASETEPVPMYELYIATAPYAPTVEDLYHYLVDEWRVSRLFTKAVGFDRTSTLPSSKVPTHVSIPAITQEDRDHFQRQYSKIRPDFQDRFATIVYACRKYVWKNNGSGGEVVFLSNKELYAVEKYTKKFNADYKRKIADAAAEELISSDQAANLGSPSTSNNAGEESLSKSAKKKAKKKAKKAAAVQEDQDVDTAASPSTSGAPQSSHAKATPSIPPPAPPEEPEEVVDKGFESALRRVREIFVDMQFSGGDPMMMFYKAEEWQSAQIQLLNTISSNHNQAVQRREKSIEKARQTIVAAYKIRQEREKWIPSSIKRVCETAVVYNKDRARLDSKLTSIRSGIGKADKDLKKRALRNATASVNAGVIPTKKSKKATAGSDTKPVKTSSATSDKSYSQGRRLALKAISADLKKNDERREEDIELFLDEFIPVVLLKAMSSGTPMRTQVEFCTRLEESIKQDIYASWDFTFSTRNNISMFLDRSVFNKQIDNEQSSMIMDAYDLSHMAKMKERDLIDKEYMKSAEYIALASGQFTGKNYVDYSSDYNSEDDELTDDEMPNLVSDDETRSKAAISTGAIKTQAKPTAPTAAAINSRALAETANGKASRSTKPSTTPTSSKADSTDDDLPDLISGDDNDDDNGGSMSQTKASAVDKSKGKFDNRSKIKSKLKENRAEKVKKLVLVAELSYSSDGETTDDDMPELLTDEDTRVVAESDASDDEDDDEWSDEEDEEEDDDLTDPQTSDDDDDHNDNSAAKAAVTARLNTVTAPPVVKDVIAEAMERIIQAQKESRAEKEASRVAEQIDILMGQRPKLKERQQLAEKTEKLSKSLLDQAGRSAMLQIAKDHAKEVDKEKYIQKKAAEDKTWAEMDAQYRAASAADEVAKARAEMKALQRVEVEEAMKADAEEAARVEAEVDRIVKEKAQADRIAREKAKAERIAKEKAEADRIAKEKAEADRIAKEKAEADRIAKEKAKADRIAKEEAEAERVALEKADAERVAREKVWAERLAKMKAETERLAKERAEAERVAKEKAEAERLAREKAKAEKLAREKAEAERQAREKAERLLREKAEADRIAKERAEAERVATEKAEAERIAREKAQAERLAKEKAEAERLAKEKIEAERIAKEQAVAKRLSEQRAEAERVAREKAEANRLAMLTRLDLLRKNLDEAIAKEAHMIDSTKETINKILLDQSMAQNIHLKTQEQMTKQEAEAKQVSDNAWTEKLANYRNAGWFSRETDLSELEALRDEENRKIREAINTRSTQWAAAVASSDREFEAQFDAVQAMIDPLSRARVAAHEALKEAEEEMSRLSPSPTEEVVKCGPDAVTISAIVDGARAAEDARVEARRLKAEAIAQAKAEAARQKEEARLKKLEAKQQKRLENREKTRLKQEAEKAAIELAKSLGEPVRMPTTPGEFSYDWQSINFNLPIWKVPTEHLAMLETWVNHWYPQLQSDEESLIERHELLARLQSLFDAQFPDAGLQLRPFGSYITGLGNKYSDIDICVFVEPEQFQPYAPHSDVRHLAWFLENQEMQNVIAITDAKVPIVKFVDPITGIHCDMNVQHPLGIYNSALIKAYMEIDARLEKFLLLLKYFAKAHGILDGSSGYLCSYAYILMAIVFFQEQFEPILPRLQIKTEKPKPFTEKGKSRRKEKTFGQCVQDGTIPPVYVTQDGKIFDCTFDTRIDLYKGFGSLNKKPVSRLLFEFFEYFSRRFDYRTMEVSPQYGRMQERHVITREKRQLLQANKLSMDGSSNNNRGLLPANGNNNVGPMTRNGYFYDTRRALWVNPTDIAYFDELEANGIVANGTNGANETGVGSPGFGSPGIGVPPSPAMSTTSSMSVSSTTSTLTNSSTGTRASQAFFCVMDPFIYNRNVAGTCRGPKLERVWRCFDYGYRTFALGEFSSAFEQQEFEMDAVVQQQSQNSL